MNRGVNDMCERDQECSEKQSLLRDAGFRDDEEAVLHIARRYCASYTRPKRPYWEDAIDVAVARFGDFHGPAIAVATLNVLRRLRPSRKSVFRFNNPYCDSCSKKLTECERRLMQTLHCVRCNDQSGAVIEAMILCEGRETEPFIEEVGRLSSALIRDDRVWARTLA